MFKDPVMQAMPWKWAKTSLISEVLIDHEVSEKISQMCLIRKTDLHGIFVELLNLHGPHQFFSVNIWCTRGEICSQDKLPGCYRETTWKSLSLGAFKIILSPSGIGN